MIVFNLSKCLLQYAFSLRIDELEDTNDVVTVQPEEVVAEKKTLLSKVSKLQSFEKKEEIAKVPPSAPEEPPHVVEAPKPPPKKVEVNIRLHPEQYISILKETRAQLVAASYLHA